MYPTDYCKTKTGFRNLSLTAFLGLLCFPLLVNSQETCKDLHSGIFYSYPKNSSERYVSERDGKWQKENNLSNGDSILWQVDWKDDCSYTLKYVSGGKQLSKESIAVLNQHKIFYEIEKVTPRYYTFSGYLDKKSTIPITKDTMWMQEKLVVSNNELFKPYKTRIIPRKDRFSDTSQYAVLYIYRPGKLTNSVGSYLVYLDENPLWVAQNNSCYVFKILKEGKFRISSRLLKDQSFADVDFRFGHTYFVKSKIKWGFYKGRNFKLEMEEMDAEKGKKEFDETEFR